MKWSEQTWHSIDAVYASIIQMPFIEELANGRLPAEKFQFYMAQDSMYLEHFGRTLAMIGAKALNINDALSYIRFAENAIVVEEALHVSFFKDFGLTDKGSIQPACHHYVNFLKSTAAFEPVEVAMAATLPCFWIYKQVGDHIYQNQNIVSNPYQRWIETYGGQEFAAAVNLAINICDNAAAKSTADIREKMTRAFITSSQLEYNFWKAAYNMTMW